MPKTQRRVPVLLNPIIINLKTQTQINPHTIQHSGAAMNNHNSYMYSAFQVYLFRSLPTSGDFPQRQQSPAYFDLPTVESLKQPSVPTIISLHYPPIHITLPYSSPVPESQSFYLSIHTVTHTYLTSH